MNKVYVVSLDLTCFDAHNFVHINKVYVVSLDLTCFDAHNFVHIKLFIS